MFNFPTVYSLIPLPHSDPPQTLRWGDIRVYKICAIINTVSSSTWHQTEAVVNRARPSSRRRCRQLLYTECDVRNLLFTIVVRCVTVDDAKVEQEAGQLLFRVQYSCLLLTCEITKMKIALISSFSECCFSVFTIKVNIALYFCWELNAQTLLYYFFFLLPRDGELSYINWKTKKKISKRLSVLLVQYRGLISK